MERPKTRSFNSNIKKCTNIFYSNGGIEQSWLSLTGDVLQWKVAQLFKSVLPISIPAAEAEALRAHVGRMGASFCTLQNIKEVFSTFIVQCILLDMSGHHCTTFTFGFLLSQSLNRLREELWCQLYWQPTNPWYVSPMFCPSFYK